MHDLVASSQTIHIYHWIRWNLMILVLQVQVVCTVVPNCTTVTGTNVPTIAPMMKFRLFGAGGNRLNDRQLWVKQLALRRITTNNILGKALISHVKSDSGRCEWHCCDPSDSWNVQKGETKNKRTPVASNVTSFQNNHTPRSLGISTS